jgi:hypothetical protein
MYCPKCGQSQVSADVRFCSRCGFPLVVVGNLLATSGVLPPGVSGGEVAGVRSISPRRRGVKHGFGLLLISILLIPFFGILNEAIGLPTRFMSLAGIAAIGAVLRIIYALFFEETSPQFASSPPPPELYTPPIAPRLHAPTPAAPIDDYRQPQVRTAEIVRPPSVTDHTTRLLDKQTDPSEQ